MTRLTHGHGYMEQLVDELRSLPYDTLSGLLEMETLPTPAELSGLRFVRKRRAGDLGGVEITVSVKKRVFFFLSVMYQNGFEIFPDGRIEELCPLPPADD